MNMAEDVAIMVTNERQRKFLITLHRLHLIKITKSQSVKSVLASNDLFLFAYVSGWNPIVNKLYHSFANGFLIPANGPERDRYGRAKSIFDEFTAAAEKLREEEEGCA